MNHVLLLVRFELIKSTSDYLILLTYWQDFTYVKIVIRLYEMWGKIVITYQCVGNMQIWKNIWKLS